MIVLVSKNCILRQISQTGLSETQYTPHVGDDISTLAPVKYRSIRAAASRREPVPERP